MEKPKANDDPRSDNMLCATHQLLQEQADKLDNQNLRRSFLENMTIHREIDRLYRDILMFLNRNFLDPFDTPSIKYQASAFV